MKKKSPQPPTPSQPGESAIRAYAYHLYEQSSCAPGHDDDNWFEATAYLQTNMPVVPAAARLVVKETGSATYEAHALGDLAGRTAHYQLTAESVAAP